jgi:hypothetical protein
VIHAHSPISGRLIHTGKLQCLLALMSLFSTFSYSQTPGKDETLVFINRLLGEQTRVELKGGTLFVTFRDENNKVVREDKVPTPDLDLKITWEQEGGLLCIPCFRDQPECVTRVLVVQKIKRGYGRLSIPVRSEKDFESLKKAFDHLIRITSEDGYKDAITLD